MPGISENIATAIQARLRNTYGDTQLGSEYFDLKLIDYIVEEFKKEQGFDLRSDPHSFTESKSCC